MRCAWVNWRRPVSRIGPSRCPGQQMRHRQTRRGAGDTVPPVSSCMGMKALPQIWMPRSICSWRKPMPGTHWLWPTWAASLQMGWAETPTPSRRGSGMPKPWPHFWRPKKSNRTLTPSTALASCTPLDWAQIRTMRRPPGGWRSPPTPVTNMPSTPWPDCTGTAKA